MSAAVDPYVGLIIPADDDTTPGWSFEGAVAEEVTRQRVRDAARAALAAEKRSALVLPPLRTLRAFLAEPDPPVAYRVDRAWPTGGRVVLAAAQKAGKSTAVGNVLRSLADGAPLFGALDVVPVSRVVLLDNELDERMLRRWLRDHGITRPERVDLVPLRGRLSTFDILEPGTRAAWAEHIGPADVLILDCLRPALDALGLDENRDAGRFLEAFDELLTEAGIGEAIVVHHHGHNGERSRGDSRILDWPDAVWNLVRESTDDETSPRYFAAYGRDVSVSQDRLDYEVTTRRLTLTGTGSRRSTAAVARRERLTEAVVDVVTASPGVNTTALEATLKARGVPFQKGDVSRAARDALEDGRMLCEPGARGAKRYYPATPTSDGARRTPTYPEGVGVTYPDPPFGGGVGRECVSSRPAPTSGYGTSTPRAIC